jgi:hypothetical protein
MARKPVTDMSAWPSLSLEGNLIAPAMVASVDRREASEQAEADYRIRKGLTIREEISTAFRVGQSHFDTFARIDNPSADATRRFIKAFLQETFGFDDLVPADGALSFIAGGRVPVVVVPPSDEKLDRRSATLSTDRTRSPAFALQDHLNEHDETLWGLVTNGTLIRLMRDNASLTRPAYIEADLSQIFTNEDAASFAVLWLLIHRTRFGAAGAPATDCALERWRDAGSKEGEVARDRLAVQVQVALKVLGSGFLEANPDLAARLKSGEVNLTEWFNELLRLVYRLIFLMVAEDRNLLHPDKAKPDARKLYAEGYSLAALRAQCYRAASWDKHHDRYEGIKIVFHALANGQDALALPALGGLFSDDKLPHLETARLRNRAFMEALYRLSWLDQKTGMVPVNWRDMKTEELGSVYESLLELQPQLGDDGKTLVFASEAAEQKGNQRKTTGSYYTPDSLVQALLDTALDPVLDQTETQADDPERALLNLSVIDPACGSGHFLLAAAHRIASRVARIRADGTPSAEDHRHALRDVARSCLHGVDRNPMAVELTKVALWIETVDPGLPLGFFDAQIRCGDALLGIFDLSALDQGIPDAAYKPLTGDDKETAKYYLRANRDAKAGQGRLDFFGGRSRLPAMRPIATEYTGFRALTEDTIADIKTKDRTFRSLRESHGFRKLDVACDLYVSAFLLPKIGGAPVSRGSRTIPTTSDVWQAMDDGQVWGPLIGRGEAAEGSRAFHWPLEFPDVMQRGGFDVVLGNPPWEVTQVSDEEYFSTRRPDIAAMKSAARKRAIADLETDAPREFALYQEAKRTADAQNEFARTSGRFELSAQGKINTYALFSELSLRLLKSEGRAGIIVPAGIATDFFRRHFFDFIVREKRIYSALMFDNQLRIFPAVHPDTPFTLLTLCEGCDRPNFTSYILRIEELSDKERYYSLSRDEIATSNPNTRTLPIFRSRQDADLITKMYKNSEVLIEIEGSVEISPFKPIVIQNFFTSSNRTDAKMFEEFGGKKDDPSFLPVRRGGSVFQFDHRYGAPEEVRKGGCDFIDADRFVPRLEVETRLSEKGWSRDWLLGWRDITNATNERTVISAVIPFSATDDTLSLLLPTLEDIKLIACLLANLNSLALDYAAQSKVGGTHIRKNTIAQFPVLAPAYYSNERLAFITPKVLELTYTSHSLAPFARDLGHDGPPFAWDEDRRAHLRADLDAFYARAYGLARDELRYILDPAEVKGPDYPSETFRVLKEKEIRQHGEYRTQRLVLAAWDRMEADGTFDSLGLGVEATAPEHATRIDLSALSDLRDEAWAWPPQTQPRDRLRYAAQYALWLSDPAQDASLMRVLIACMAEPALLTPLLSDEDRAHWSRLVGPEAQPAQGATRLRPAINGAWRDAFETLISSGQLEERDGGWIRGRHFDPAGLRPESAEAQRTAFALQAIQQLDQRQIAAAVTREDNIIWAEFRYGTS